MNTMSDTYFSLEKLLNYEGNRYELARACMEYARRVRYLVPNEYQRMGEKEALVALHHLLEGGIKYTSDRFEIEIYEDEAEVIVSQREAERLKTLEKDDKSAKDKEELAEQTDAVKNQPKKGKAEASDDEDDDEDQDDTPSSDATFSASAPSEEEEKQDNPQPSDS